MAGGERYKGSSYIENTGRHKLQCGAGPPLCPGVSYPLALDAAFARSSRCYASSLTRIRTWNPSFEARHDRPFHHQAVVMLFRRKAWDSNPHLLERRHALAVRPGQPYPAAFRLRSVRSCATMSRSWHSAAVNPSDADGNRTRVGEIESLAARPASHRAISGLQRPFKWSRMESNHRFLVVSQMSSPLDHGTGLAAAHDASGPTGNCTRIAGLQDRNLPVRR